MTRPHPPAAGAPAEASEDLKPSNFLRSTIERDLAQGTYAARRWAGQPGDAALQAAGVPAEAHLYAKGGHGFGLRPSDVPCPTDWPKRFAEWLRVMNLVPKENQ